MHETGRIDSITDVNKLKELGKGSSDEASVSMADDYFGAAKERGLYTEYIQYNCEPHGWYHWRPETVGDSIRRMAAHFKKFIETQW